MAVPGHLALPHFNANFTYNAKESDSQEPIQALQGVPYAVRKVFALAKIKVNITVEPVDSDDDASQPHFIVKSSITGLGPLGAAPLRAVGFQTENTDVRVLDGSEVDKDEPLIGKTKSRIWMCFLEEMLKGDKTDDFLKQGWEGCDAGKTYVVRVSVWSANPDELESWQNEQVWGIQRGRWTCRVAITKGKVRETARLLYDYEA